MSTKREKKIERREAKAARKAKNQVKEKESRPNNLLLAVLIFGVVIAMFGFSWGYNEYQKEASIETYMANNGGEDTFKNMAISQDITMDVTAKGNKMEIVISDKSKDTKAQKKYYKSEDGEEWLNYLAAYYLTTIKPEVRGFTASATVTANVGKKEANSIKMSYSKAKKWMEEQQAKATEEE